jgi:hypothetical protein
MSGYTTGTRTSLTHARLRRWNAKQGRISWSGATGIGGAGRLASGDADLIVPA